jgi:hypothetical protein
MPYVDAAARTRLDAGSPPATAGELNYTITKLVDAYLSRSGTPRYADFNEAIGVLECAKLELYRRLVAPYEDRKLAQHGDVYAATQP